MGLLIRVVIAALVAIIVYLVLTALVSFTYSALLFGLLAVVIFLGIAFGPWGPRTGVDGRRW